MDFPTPVPANGFGLATDGGDVQALGVGGVGDGGADGLEGDDVGALGLGLSGELGVV